jgi:general secretion pathway protein K
MSSLANRRSGSVLVIVMITLLFTAAALVVFMDKAGDDLLVEAHAAEANRLRIQAYSALEVTLAVLEDFRQADNGLRATSEGWGDPLAWAGWSPEDGQKVDVTFQDESGKIPLIHADSTTLNSIFQSWQIPDSDAARATDGILGWMQQNYIPTTLLSADYEGSAIPYDPPLRSMRSFSELSAIDGARDIFYGPDGRPNGLWWRFYNDFSLFNFRQIDIHGANSDVLSAVGQFSADQQQTLSDYLAGAGKYQNQGQQWFQDTGALQGVLGGLGKPAGFGLTISALRVTIAVHEGRSQFLLSAVVAPQGGATTVQTTATDVKNGASNSASGETSATTGVAAGSTSASASSISTVPTAAQAATAASSNLQYPYTVLEILENDEIPVEPPPPPAPPGQ